MISSTAPWNSAIGSSEHAKSRFRKDIEGLRAVAVLLVLGYHAGVPVLAGGYVGVDVFFVISGFLITGILLREVERTGTLRLASFYARRARRLLPASTVVLIASAVVTVTVLPVTRWATVAWDLITSALYVTNWRLASRSVDYLAAEATASPVQHFWTLAVEEQFYVVWPLLVLALVLLHRRTGWQLRKLLFVGIGLLTASSLLWAIYLTFSSPSRAYFVSTTRVWELAIGAMLAFGIGRAERLPAGTSKVFVTFGVAAIGYAAVTFDAATAFPGPAALLPTLGAALVITGGTSLRLMRGNRLLTNPAMTVIGGLSYSLYLWHWPMLVGAKELWALPGEQLAVPVALVVVVMSGIPAWLTYRFIERPIHHLPALAHSNRRNLGLALSCTAIGVLAACFVLLALPGSMGSTQANFRPVGARALVGSGAPTSGETSALNATNPDGTVPFTPDPIEALQDVAALAGQRCIAALETVSLEPCVYGPTEAETTVAIVGDSKMHQWLPAIEHIAAQRDWRIVTYLKSGCALARLPMRLANDEPNRPCTAHNELRIAELLAAEDIDVVLTSQGARAAYTPDADIPRGRELLIDDLAGVWNDLADRGIAVVVILDNASPPVDIPECVAANLHTVSNCDFARDKAVTASAAPIQRAAVQKAPHAKLVDLQDGICGLDTCPAVVGNILVYRQGSHLTNRYVESLTEWFDQRIQQALHG